MKGLLVKDIRIFLRQKTTFFLIILLGIFFSTNGGDISLSVGYIMMLSATLVITTVSYDYFEKGMSFLFTFPVTRKMYVLEKYVLSASMGLVVAVFGCVLNVVAEAWGAQVPWNEFAGITAASMAAAMIILSVYLPVYMKCGPEKSRVAILIVIGGMVAVGYLGYMVVKMEAVQEALIPVVRAIEKMTAVQVVGICAAVWALIVTVSVIVSIKILEKKEF